MIGPRTAAGALIVLVAVGWQALSTRAEARPATTASAATTAPLPGAEDEKPDAGSAGAHDAAAEAADRSARRNRPRTGKFEFPHLRPPVYLQSGMGDPSHPYNYASVETLHELAEHGDGAAAWHLSSRYLARDMQRAKLYAIQASVLLQSGEPILLLIENHLMDRSEREEALPYLLIAGELGSAERVARWLQAWDVTAQEIEAGQPALERLRAVAREVRAERAGG